MKRSHVNKNKSITVRMIIAVLLTFCVMAGTLTALTGCSDLFEEKPSSLGKWAETEEGQDFLKDVETDINNDQDKYYKGEKSFKFFVRGNDKLVYHYIYKYAPETQEDIDQWIKEYNSADRPAMNKEIASVIGTLRSKYDLEGFVIVIEHADKDGKVFYTYTLTQGDAE